MKWGTLFDVAGASESAAALEELSLRPEFWGDMENSQKRLKELKSLKNRISAYRNLCAEYDDLVTLADMGIEENDAEIALEAKSAAKSFKANFEELRMRALLNGEYDKNNAIVTLHSGAGGTEACDWANMLFRMYSRWAEKRGYDIETIDCLQGEEAGVKSVTFLVSGENAYGFMRAEKGVHRLVRISPFDASGRRHTSFASCDVMPELEDDAEIEINSDDIRIDTFRSSGAGGQHVNKTDSAIRITHMPTGVVVQCQNERSQHKNKDFAMKMLKAKLYEIKVSEQAAKTQGIRGEVKDIAWGSQIRSYVFHPYSMVKDHRTNEEVGNVQAVMDGDIDVFINSYLVMNSNFSAF